MKKKDMKNCMGCGQEVNRPRSYARFCSPKCYQTYYNRTGRRKEINVKYYTSDKGHATKAKNRAADKLKAYLKIDSELKCAGCGRTGCKLTINHNNGGGRAEKLKCRGANAMQRDIAYERMTTNGLSLLCDPGCHDIFHRKGRCIKYFESYTDDQKDRLLRFLKSVDPLFRGLDY